LIRLEETRGQSLLSLLSGYRSVLGQILRTPQTLYTLGVMLVLSATNTINSTFWAILVTEKLKIAQENISLYAFARSGAMLLFFFLVMPRIRGLHFRNPMLVGLLGYIINQLILITMPERSYLLLLLGVMIDACSIAAFGIFLDKMVVITVNPEERARILSILYVIMILFTSPFGWIGGLLSEINRTIPFIVNIALYSIGGLLIYQTSRKFPNRENNLGEEIEITQPA
jgi:hypothetical protein